MQKKLIIFGTGEMSEIANYYFSSHTDYQILGFTINEDYLKTPPQEKNSYGVLSKKREFYSKIELRRVQT